MKLAPANVSGTDDQMSYRKLSLRRLAHLGTDYVAPSGQELRLQLARWHWTDNAHVENIWSGYLADRSSALPQVSNADGNHRGGRGTGRLRASLVRMLQVRP